MPATADRCKETTTTTGTGDITLAGAASQFQSFQSAFGTEQILVQYAIVGQSGTEWEVGSGYFDGVSTLTRERIRSSSNSNGAVNFSSGTKDVFATVTANHLQRAAIGRQTALNYGWAMP